MTRYVMVRHGSLLETRPDRPIGTAIRARVLALAVPIKSCEGWGVGLVTAQSNGHICMQMPIAVPSKSCKDWEGGGVAAS